MLVMRAPQKIVTKQRAQGHSRCVWMPGVWCLLLSSMGEKVWNRCHGGCKNHFLMFLAQADNDQEFKKQSQPSLETERAIHWWSVEEVQAQEGKSCVCSKHQESKHWQGNFQSWLPFSGSVVPLTSRDTSAYRRVIFSSLRQSCSESHKY